MFSDRPSGCPSVNTYFTWRDISIYLLVEEVNETWLPEIFITAIAEEVCKVSNHLEKKLNLFGHICRMPDDSAETGCLE